MQTHIIDSFRVPWELDDFGLDPEAFRVLLHIRRRSGSGVCHASYENMAEVCGLGICTVRRRIKLLESLNIISVTLQKDRDQTNCIVILPFRFWTKLPTHPYQADSPTPITGIAHPYQADSPTPITGIAKEYHLKNTTEEETPLTPLSMTSPKAQDITIETALAWLKEWNQSGAGYSEAEFKEAFYAYDQDKLPDGTWITRDKRKAMVSDPKSALMHSLIVLRRYRREDPEKKRGAASAFAHEANDKTIKLKML